MRLTFPTPTIDIDMMYRVGMLKVPEAALSMYVLMDVLLTVVYKTKHVSNVYTCTC